MILCLCRNNLYNLCFIEFGITYFNVIISYEIIQKKHMLHKILRRKFPIGCGCKPCGDICPNGDSWCHCTA